MPQGIILNLYMVIDMLFKYIAFHHDITVADPGGTASMHPPTGPDSFILTYKFFET